jgi:hypothetical protein
MNRYNQIKALYSISFSILLFILWSVFSKMILNNDVSYTLFIVFIVSIFVQLYLHVKDKNKNTTLIVSFFISAILNYIFNGTNSLINITSIIFLLYTNIKWLQEGNDYSVCNERVKKSIYLIIILGAVLIFFDYSNFDKYLTSLVIRFYIFFLVTSIILLREARAQQYGIKDVNNLRNNAIICGVIILMSIDNVFKIFVKIMSILLNYITLGLDIIITKLFYFVYLSLDSITNFIIVKVASLGNRSPVVQAAKSEQVKANIIKYPEWLSVTLKIFVLLSIIFVIYKLLTHSKSFSLNYNNSDTEERENLFSEKKKSKNYFKEIYTNIFKSKNAKERILGIYKKFEKRALEKDIFKPHMSASQLRNVAKIYVTENINELDIITDIYNEAKFSNHDIAVKKAVEIKNSYDNVKQKL